MRIRMEDELGKYKGYIPSSFGILELRASDLGLRAINIVDEAQELNENRFIHFYMNQLSEYLSGERTEFNLYFDWSGHNEYFISVWRLLCDIPFGETISYKELAIRIGNPLAVRAVAKANAKNPIPIIVPCHRVIGSDGSLTGYALGLNVKRKLLIHEKNLPPELF